jgi:hypothetical protein
LHPTPSFKGKSGKKRQGGHVNVMDGLMPSSDMINQELMTNFGGKELSAQFESQNPPRNPFNHTSPLSIAGGGGSVNL